MRKLFKFDLDTYEGKRNMYIFHCILIIISSLILLVILSFIFNNWLLLFFMMVPFSVINCHFSIYLYNLAHSFDKTSDVDVISTCIGFLIVVSLVGIAGFLSENVGWSYMGWFGLFAIPYWILIEITDYLMNNNK